MSHCARLLLRKVKKAEVFMRTVLAVFSAAKRRSDCVLDNRVKRKAPEVFHLKRFSFIKAYRPDNANPFLVKLK